MEDIIKKIQAKDYTSDLKTKSVFKMFNKISKSKVKVNKAKYLTFDSKGNTVVKSRPKSLTKTKTQTKTKIKTTPKTKTKIKSKIKSKTKTKK